MNIEKHNNLITLTPGKGMVLTDGESFAPTAVVLPADADASVWREITEAEALQAITRQED